jgi:monoamine oxidase
MRTTGRGVLTQKLRESLALLREAGKRRASFEEVSQEYEQIKRRDCFTRREFVSTAAAASLTLARPLRASAKSRIAVIGGGLAGLRFAHAMWTVNGIATTVYEANTRLGGRQWSNRDFFSSGQIAEHGGEFISSEHKSMRNLASHFGLELAVVNGGSDPCCNDVAWLDGSYYSMGKLAEDLKKVQPALAAANAAAPFPTLYNHYTQAGYALDHTSASDWIDQNVPGGTASKLGRVLLTDLLAEFGGEPALQSALNLIYLLGGSGSVNLAGTDEKYHVVGGNDQIAQNLAKALPQSSIQVGMTLLALKKNSDGAYTCTFQKDAGTVNVVADHVVLSLPFPQLKKVDLTQAEFSKVKMLCINNYVLGTNAKLALQFNNRPWANPDGFSGVCYTEPSSFQESWDATVSQKGPSGILERYPGGDAGGAHAFPGAAAHGVAPERYAQDFLNGVEAPFPGCQASYNGKAWLDWWEQDPFIGGAYGCYRVGNYTQFAGIENVRQGNVHFCGEATDLEFQGFMEGAVRSAERLAFHWPRL